MSAITDIRPTRKGLAALTYANSNNRKAHNNWDMDRVLMVSGSHNMSVDEVQHSMQAIWHKKGTKQNMHVSTSKKTGKKKLVSEIEAYTIIQSFDPSYDYQNKDDVKKVHKMGLEFAQKAYPDRLATVATQADGKNHILHNHIIVCNQNAVTFKDLRGRRKSAGYVAGMSNKVLLHNNDLPILAKSPVAPSTMRQIKQRAKGKPLNVDVIRDRMDELMQDTSITDWDTLQQKAQEKDLDIMIKRTKTGKVSRISYKLLDSDMKQGIRPKRLGTIYAKENLNEFLQTNARNKENSKGLRTGITRLAEQSARPIKQEPARNVSQSKAADAKPIRQSRVKPKHLRYPTNYRRSEEASYYPSFKGYRFHYTYDHSYDKQRAIRRAQERNKYDQRQAERIRRENERIDREYSIFGWLYDDRNGQKRNKNRGKKQRQKQGLTLSNTGLLAQLAELTGIIADKRRTKQANRKLQPSRRQARTNDNRSRSRRKQEPEQGIDFWL